MKQTNWRKLGLLHCSDNDAPFLISHASCPTVQHIAGNVFRVWHAPRDAQNRTYSAWFEFDITSPNRVLRHAQAPSVSPGGLGEFDYRGAMFSWWLQHQGREYIYYTGWTLGDDVPFRNSIGVAISNAGEDVFVKQRGPVLDRSPLNPLFVGNPCVVVAGGVWHLWYLTGAAWHTREDGPPFSDYNIRHAVSEDGLNWRVTPTLCIDYAHPGEMAIARPSVLHNGKLFRMWYSYRGRDFPYRLGYAESRNGMQWERKDDLIDLPRSPSGWDSEMICYPYVFFHEGLTYIIYCGNGFSRGGVGLAILEA